MTAAEIEHVIELAGLAPSLHNSQPWRFRVLPHVIELHYDPSHRLPATDPSERELRLACGAALFNLRLALEGAGVRPVVTLLPHLAEPTVLAEIRSGGRAEPRPERLRLRDAIPKRHSHRAPFRDIPVPAADRNQMLHAAQAEQCWLHLITPGEVGPLEGLVHRAHRVQEASPRFRAEMAAWTGRPADVWEGVPASAAGPKPGPQDQWVHRDFSAGTAARPEGLEYESHPLLAVLCSHREGQEAELQAGQAAQHVWLTATDRGLSASMISEVIEVPDTRDELRQMLGGTLHPQALLRIGYGGGAAVPAPRRAVDDLILDDDT
ncbi:nitroreductase [Saccharopolyspora rhizosphaerae]|uniref:Nitroreductase n=1 Tax=Saccharopolyspora rhizosphaerae TaxID=2492662 RepID=A0A426K0B2_9PSEU|nr:nitroreductase [Saccharopolyspora rhizosphaerae]